MIIEQEGNSELTSRQFCRACKQVLGNDPGYHFPELGRLVCWKSINIVERSLAVVYYYCTGTSNLCESPMHNGSDEEKFRDVSLTTER